MKVIIELQFDNKKNDYEVNDKEVYEYLKELMYNNSLTYTTDNN